MIKIGVRAHDYGRDTPEKLFAEIHGDGFSCIQLAFQKAVAGVEQFSDITPALVERTAAALRSQDLSLAVLGVYIDPALPDNALREKNTALFINSIPIAEKLDADCIGTETTSQSKQTGMTQKEAQNALLRSLLEIMPVAEQNGVTVAIEPVYYHTVNTPETAREILNIVSSQNLRIIFDPVNLLSPDEIPNQNRLWGRCFECFGDRIAAVHIKGISRNGNQQLVRTDLEHSIIHYSVLFSMLRQLPQPFSVLREEAEPDTAKTDCAFLKWSLT